MSELAIRAPRDDERLAFARAVSHHFFEDEPDDQLRPWEPVVAAMRCLVAVDGDRIAANFATLPVDVSVPGGELLPCAGITAVGVSQTHRRRGLLRRLMSTGLDDAVEHGEPVAALYASESTIYPRFGFGVAAPSVRYRIDGRGLSFRDPVAGVPVVDLDPEGAPAAAAAVYELLRAARGGGVGRVPAQWDHRLRRDPPENRDGASGKHRIHVPGRGYAVYRVRDGFDGMLPAGEVRLLELVAVDPEAEQALWQHVLDVDLTTTVEAHHRPPDDALPWMVDDPMRLRAAAGPPLYVRLLDVARCLASRTAAVTDGLVLEVHDADRDQDGRYRWDVSPEGSACTRTDADPDVTLSVETLAACWLGGTSASHLRAGRRVVEHRAGTVARLDRMTAVDLAPWTPWEF